MLDVDWLFETREGCCAVGTCPENATTMTTTTEATTTQVSPTTTTTKVTPWVSPTTTTTKATTNKESPPQWYPHFDSYDEVRLDCCVYLYLNKLF